MNETEPPVLTDEEMIAAGLCVHHDEPVDRNGKCPECYWQDAAHAENERDIRSLWNQR